MSPPVPALDLHFPVANAGLAEQVSTALHDLCPTAVHELGPELAPTWRVFFASPQERDDAGRSLARQFGSDGLDVAPTSVADEDWAARSQANLTHVQVGRLIVAPPWDVPTHLPPGGALIVIKPSMGFGTGHHETTRLCLRLLQQLEVDGRRVVDAGTGSGVLAIAAATLGARAVIAFDVDPDAVACALENVALNETGRSPLAGRIHVAVGSVEDARPAADIVLANLTGATLVASATSLLALAVPGGHLVLSGILAHEADAVVQAFRDVAECESVVEEGEWRALLMRTTP